MLQLVREGHGCDQWAEARLIDKVPGFKGQREQMGCDMGMSMAWLGLGSSLNFPGARRALLAQ